MVASQVASSYTAGPNAPVGIKLQIRRAANGSLVISWPASAASYFLEMSPTLAPTPAWDIVSETPVESGGFMTVTLPASGSMGFFRLSQ
jgi:hypothetical protein